MVTRNEAGRYLAATLSWLTGLVEQVCVFDDRSDDDTVAVAERCGAHVDIRPRNVPSFTEDESRFRAAGWAQMERIAAPDVNTWILAVDADEYLVASDPEGNRDGTRQAIRETAHSARSAVVFPVAEIFGFDETGVPLVRTDGFWGCIKACRLVRWRPGAVFDERQEGGGSIPSSWARTSTTDPNLTILHYGYANAEDRAMKFERYASTLGHNPNHIASIMRAPTLKHWSGARPHQPTRADAER